MPNTRTPSINSEVAIGRRMNGSEMLIAHAAARRQVAQSCQLRQTFSSPESPTNPPKLRLWRGGASANRGRCRPEVLTPAVGRLETDPRGRREPRVGAP